jgi:four helix bundle protein
MTEKNKDKIKSFTDLFTWKESHKLVIDIYRLTDSFPGREMFGLTIQIRRAAVSISSNIAEGFGRISYKDKLRFYYTAQGSLTEVQNQLLIARDIGYINEKEFQLIAEQTVIVHKLLCGLIKKSKHIHNS